MAATPMSASGFLSGFGVDTHIPYTDETYANLTNVVADLNYLGITQVRDGISNGEAGSAPLSSYITLAQQGIKFTFVVSGGGDLTTADVNNTISLIDQVNKAVPGSVIAVEGPNEINNFGMTYNGVGGIQGAVNMQHDLYAAVHSDPNLPGVAVDYFTGYGYGGIGNGPDPHATLGLANFDNQHPYPNNGTAAPGKTVDPANGGTGIFNETAPFGPFVYTETGYSTRDVSASTQAKYTLDLLMDTAKDGSAHTYLYELMNESDNFGLFTGASGTTPTQAATGIHNLTTILAYNGAGGVAPTPMNDVITGLPSTGNSFVLEKSNGAFDIAVWNEKIGAAATSVVVQLGATYQTVNVFDPLAGSTPIHTYSNVSSVNLSLTDHLLIVEAEPGVVGVHHSPHYGS